MAKRELAVRISATTKLPQQQVAAVIQMTLDGITDSLAKGETVEFRDFGVFHVKATKPRIGRNPNKPSETVVIPERKVVKFKAGKIMRARVLES